MKILYTAFNGNNNSSKILLDKIKCSEENKLYLRNSFVTSVKQLEKKIKLNDYDLIISFGQCPLKENEIKLETTGQNGEIKLNTNYDFNIIKNKLIEENFNVVESSEAGNYLCNNIYFNGLKIIHTKKLKSSMIFIHIPMLGKINIEKIANIFSEQ